MDPVLAIDFGTSNSAAAVLLPDATVMVLRDHTPHRPTTGATRTKAFPTYLYCDEAGEWAAVGAAAKDQAAVHPHRVIHSLKPLLGKSYLQAEADGDLARLVVPVMPDAETGQCLFEIGGRSIRPQEACAFLLRHIRAVAETATGLIFRDVVVSAPAYHTGNQLAALQEAARLAGFDGRIDVVPEPLAAALAMDRHITPRPDNTLVLDLGGGTTDVSVSELSRVAPGPFGLRCRSLGNAGNNALGGLLFDDRLFDHLRSIFRCGTLSDEDRVRLRQATEAAKIQLSDALTAEVNVELGGRAHRHLLTRAELEAALRGGGRDLLAAIEVQIRAALAKAGWRPEDDVDLLALVGGPTAMPCVRQVVRQIFYRNAAVLAQIDAAAGVDPMTAVAVGGAKYRAAETVNRCPFGYGYVAVTAAPAGKQDVYRIRREAVSLIECNTPFPSPMRTEMAQIAQYRGDNVVGVEIIEVHPAAGPDGEERDAGHYRFLGVRHLPVDNDSFGVVVEIGARLNENGEFELTLRSLLDGRSVTYVGTGSARRHAIELPTERLEHSPPRHGYWVFVPDYAGGVRQWAETLHARLQATGLSARADAHLDQALADLGSAVAASPRIVGAERQANDLYLAGRRVLARAHELRLLADPEAAAQEAALEAARRACYRYEEAALDATEA